MAHQILTASGEVARPSRDGGASSGMAIIEALLRWQYLDCLTADDDRD